MVVAVAACADDAIATCAANSNTTTAARLQCEAIVCRERVVVDNVAGRRRLIQFVHITAPIDGGGAKAMCLIAWIDGDANVAAGEHVTCT